jgi:hypothetical protein
MNSKDHHSLKAVSALAVAVLDFLDIVLIMTILTLHDFFRNRLAE